MNYGYDHGIVGVWKNTEEALWDMLSLNIHRIWKFENKWTETVYVISVLKRTKYWESCWILGVTESSLMTLCWLCACTNKWTETMSYRPGVYINTEEGDEDLGSRNPHRCLYVSFLYVRRNELRQSISYWSDVYKNSENRAEDLGVIEPP